MAYSKAIGIKLENYHIDQCIIDIFNEVESKKNRNTFYFTLLRTIVISKLQGGVRRRSRLASAALGGHLRSKTNKLKTLGKHLPLPL